MLLEEIIKDIKRKKELKNIDDEFVKQRVVELLNKYKINLDDEKLKKNKKLKIIFKEVRKQLREVYGAFRQVEDKRDNIVYEKIFEFIEDCKSVLDIGCGELVKDYLNYKKKFYLCDIDIKLVDELNKYIKKNKINGEAFVFNAASGNYDKLPKVDAVLLLRALEGFEAVNRNVSYELLKNLKCKKIVVSFSKVTLSNNKRIRKMGRIWFVRFLQRLNYQYKIENIGKEIVFFINK